MGSEANTVENRPADSAGDGGELKTEPSETHPWQCDCEWCWIGLTSSPVPPTIWQRARNYYRNWRGKGAATMDHCLWAYWVVTGRHPSPTSDNIQPEY